MFLDPTHSERWLNSSDLQIDIDFGDLRPYAPLAEPAAALDLEHREASRTRFILTSRVRSSGVDDEGVVVPAPRESGQR